MSFNTVQEAYEAASLSWLGCDWPTRFGEKQLDLNGLRSGRAAELAENAREGSKAELARAADWLADVELQAAAAEEEGCQALESARLGDLPKALGHAQQACWIEQASGRCLHRAPAWPRLCHAISQAMKHGGPQTQGTVTLPAEEFHRMLTTLALLRGQVAFQRHQLYALHCQLKEVGQHLDELDASWRQHDPTLPPPVGE